LASDFVPSFAIAYDLSPTFLHSDAMSSKFGLELEQLSSMRKRIRRACFKLILSYLVLN